MIISTVPLLFTVAGLLAYALSANPKVAELGRLTFAVSLLVVLWHFSGLTFRLG